MNKVALILFTLITPICAYVYEVGPSHEFENIKDVPIESLNPGDTVKIFYRSTPYRDKWVIARAGTPDSPVVFTGVPNGNGNLPVVDGDSARTRLQLDYWSEERAIINVGGSNFPSDTPRYIVIENLEIIHARPPYAFYDDGGDVAEYSSNAASIDVIYGDHITIRNCVIHDCANGIFTCHGGSFITVEGNYIYDNGMENSYYVHNSYTESYNIIFQFNRYGPLRENCGGNNLKDRSAGTVIRYNWIEAGNRQLDLVESDYSSFYNSPIYRKTFVYGNILYESGDEGNSQIIHYGGDGGNTDAYRKGTLYLYNNTVISKRSGYTTLMNLSTNNEHCDMRNNIVYVTQSGNNLAMLDANGYLMMKNNWLNEGWVTSHEGSNFHGQIVDSGGNIPDENPYFVDFNTEDFHLAGNSPCINSGTDLNPECLPMYDILFQYKKHCSSEDRNIYGIIDMGAFEYNPAMVGEYGHTTLYGIITHNGIIKIGRLHRNDVVKIYSRNGRLVKRKKAKIKGVMIIDTKNIPSGIYIVSINGQYTRKIKIIQMR